LKDEISLGTIIENHRQDIMQRWLRAQTTPRVLSLIKPEEQSRVADELLMRLSKVHGDDVENQEFAEVRSYLDEISRIRALQGFTPSETAVFVFSLKDAILPAIQQSFKDDATQVAREIMRLNKLIDALGLRTFETYTASREEYIHEQQHSILELSTPVVEVWQGILMLPLVGTLDTARTQQMMETLLNHIVGTKASYVIIDITGVPLVDTAVARHLLQTVTAARMLGADCIIVGISARIAQTLVHLCVDLSMVRTDTTLSKGLDQALSATGLKIVSSDEKAY
jgi:rsbT co-antagonist protein RsbR